MPRLIYIAGPYRVRSNSLWNILGLRTIRIAWNIHKARRLAKLIWRIGDYAICPHSNTAFFDGICPDSQFLDGSLEMLRHCDMVVLTKDYMDSEGARAELRVALILGKPVYLEREGALTLFVMEGE